MRDNPYESIDPAPSAKKPKKEELPEIQARVSGREGEEEEEEGGAARGLLKG
jgi:hypothetical protein